MQGGTDYFLDWKSGFQREANETLVIGMSMLIDRWIASHEFAPNQSRPPFVSWELILYEKSICFRPNYCQNIFTQNVHNVIPIGANRPEMDRKEGKIGQIREKTIKVLLFGSLKFHPIYFPLAHLKSILFKLILIGAMVDDAEGSIHRHTERSG